MTIVNQYTIFGNSNMLQMSRVLKMRGLTASLFLKGETNEKDSYIV